jgi:hypothetical protein
MKATELSEKHRREVEELLQLQHSIVGDDYFCFSKVGTFIGRVS